MPTSTRTRLNRMVVMLALIISGECIFILPFVLARIFRPTVLDVFGLTNLQLGTAFAVIGTVAMLAYFPGGLLADRFPARWLMTFALITTGMGGILLASIPPLNVLRQLYFYWGVTTMLFFGRRSSEPLGNGEEIPVREAPLDCSMVGGVLPPLSWLPFQYLFSQHCFQLELPLQRSSNVPLR
ncbi:MAG: MFS transporter [Verrucomicrobia bacterium]|nr:MFS transporter [Verrucomicrobiota bacterium]